MCSKQGCKELIDYGAKRCEAHAIKDHLRYDQYRESAAKRGYDHVWRAARSRYLKKNPVCVKCIEKGFAVQSTVVDHIKPHKGNKKLFWDKSNWQALCASCHSTKTVREDGGFGR
ncbi:HNH endonuclease signature motif containing protein [Paenibacillus pinihumi]|uniref:HNH endonuclease n=1 Tax=Paenibacillus pinihumi TaxID=669462 RepID=UPI00316AD81D